MKVRSINSLLKMLCPDMKIRRGKGYFYFETADGRDVPESIYTNDPANITGEDVLQAIREHWAKEILRKNG